MIEEYKFELFPERTLHVVYVRDVKNSRALRQALLNQEINVALVNAKLVVDKFQLQVAAQRALMCDLNKSLTTKTLHAELVFNLSGSRNVAESFRRFGISDESTSLLVCAFDADSEKLTSLKTLAVGKMTSINELAQDADVKLIKKYYKIQEPELSFSSLLDAIVCRIATKSCLK